MNLIKIKNTWTDFFDKVQKENECITSYNLEFLVDGSENYCSVRKQWEETYFTYDLQTTLQHKSPNVKRPITLYIELAISGRCRLIIRVDNLAKEKVYNNIEELQKDLNTQLALLIKEKPND